MKCFVTGATGFLGGFLVRELLDQGHSVRALIRNESNAKHLELWGVELIVGDATKTSHVQKAMDGIDWVFHAAGTSSGWNLKPKDIYNSNVDSLRTVVDIASLSQIQKIVYISCCTAVGPTGETPIKEDAPWREKKFLNICHESQYIAHLESVRYCGAGLPYVSVYPGFIYGPALFNRETLLNHFVRKGLKGRQYPVLGDGTQVLNLVYVRDAVKGIIKAAQKGVPGNSYFLGGENITLQKTLETLAEVSGKPFKRKAIGLRYARLFATLDEWLAILTNEPPLYTRGLIDILSENWAIDSGKAAVELDYQPSNFKDGLLKLRDYLQSNPAKSAL
jgi:nucleoside-diphosphate-sugar epimerase